MFTLLLSLPASAIAQLSDDFNGGLVDTNKWQVVLPFKNKVIWDWTSHNVTSTASQSNGELLLRGGGFVTSRQSFNAPYVYAGTFTQSSGRTMISLRGDGASFEPSYGGPSGNIMLFLFGDPNNTPNWKVEILQSTQANPYWFQPVSETFRNNNFPLTADGPNTFSIADNGTSLEVKINDVLISRSTVSAADFGGHVSIASQWSGAVDVDSLNVRSQGSPTDSDKDGINNYREGKDGTDPNRASSFNPLSKGLVAHYPFDGNAKDESGFSQTAKLSANAKYGARGTGSGKALKIVGKGFFFREDVAEMPALDKSNAGEFVEIPEPSLHDPGVFTASIWVNEVGVSNSAGEAYITAGYAGQSVALAANYGQVGGQSTLSTQRAVTFQNPLQDLGTPAKLSEIQSMWINYTVVSDGATISLYKNGSKVHAGSFAAKPKGNWSIGRHWWDDGGTFSTRLIGSVSDFRIYNRPLTSFEVQQLYAAEAGVLDSDGDGLTDAWERGLGRYQVVLGNFTWSQAKADAEAKGGHLATITSSVEWSQIVSFAGDSIQQTLWAGGHRPAGSSPGITGWQWVTGESFSYSKWYSGEPNDTNFSFEQTLTVTWPGQPLGFWNDARNQPDGVVKGYILERGYPTDPLKADTDSDGFNDRAETDAGTDPNDAAVRPRPPMSALHFRGDKDTLRITGSTTLDTTVTIEAIVKLDTAQPIGPDARQPYQNIFTEDWMGRGSAGQVNFGVTTAGLMGFAAPNYLGDFMTQKAVNVSQNEWHHAAYVIDSASERLYLNGNLYVSRPSRNQNIWDSTTSSFLGYGWLGYVSSFRISKVARYTGVTYPKPGLKLTSDDSTLLLYNFASVSGNTINDESGNGRHGTLGGSTLRAVNATAPVLVPIDAPTDTDNDGVNDYREGKDGTDPNNVSSFNPLSKGLVAYYPFDGNAKDESGNGRNATVSGGAVLSSDRWGAPSAAFSFDGIDDVIQRDGALVDCSTATGITFSGWVYYASAPAGAPFVSSQNVASFSGWGIWNYQGRISGLSGRRYVAPLMQIDANKIASSGQWYHVVLSSEFGNSTSRLYVDGALQKESRQPVVNDVLLDRLAIGKWLGTETHLKGKCDAVRVYDRALSATEVAQLYKAESQNPNMIAVKGGTLPPSSEWLAGQKVEDFEIGKYEVTWGEWKVVRSWAVTNGYTDLANVGAGSGDDHPVRNVNWYDVVKWCNAKSQMEGLVPVYEVNGSVYRTGQAAPTTKSSATGYRLPTEAEWEWTARGGVNSKGYVYSGGDNRNDVSWNPDNSIGSPVSLDRGSGTWPVGQKVPNELGIYDMSGNVFEWTSSKSDQYRIARGGSWSAVYMMGGVSLRSLVNPIDVTDAHGFRLTRNVASSDATPPVVKITSIAANARLTTATATFAGTVTEAVSKPALQYRLGTNGVWSNSVVGGAASPYSFSQSITLRPGPNAVQFQAQDGAGNKSAIAAVNVSYVVPATLNVAVPNAADGSISSGFGGNTAREVGVTYTITAIPASGMVFKQWLKNGTSFSTNAALTFKMEAGLKLTPVFVPDFAKLGGVYNGLVGTGQIGSGSAADSQAFAASNGFIQINTAANGALSGVLRIQGGNHPFTGTMGNNKKAALTIARPGKAAATAALNLTTALPGEISGTVTAGGAAIPFRALRGGHTASTGTHALGGRRYGIVLPPPAGIALGYGYGTLTVDNDGSAVLAARLPTGQAINAGARIVDDGKGNWVFPVYTGAFGIFTGEIVIPKTAPATGSELGGSLEWLKTPGSSGPAKDGFLKALQPLGARHNVAAAGLGGAAFTLHLDPARRILSAPLLQAGQWGNGAAPGLSAPVRSALNVGFNPLSGEFRGSFTRSKNGVPVITPFQGGLFSRPLTIPGGTALRGAGFFNDGSSSAAVEVRSP